MSKAHISIIGSCVCRDAFSIPQGAEEYGKEENEYTVDRFIQSINPLSAISQAVNEPTAALLVEESKSSSAPPFYKRCYMLDVTKSWKKYLSEVSSDYLVIDFSPVRLDCRKIGGSLVTFDDIGRTVALGIDQGSPREATNILIGGENIALSDLSENELKEIYFKYMDELLELYPENNIIVVEARHTRTFLSPESGRIATTNHTLDRRYERDNRLIDFAYGCAKEKLKGAHFIDTLPVSVGNVNHKWGQGGLHLVDEVYLYIYRAIDAIIHRQMSKNEERLFLFELREKYAKMIFDKYCTAVNEHIQQSRNLMDYSKGMTPGDYEKNGVLLTVNEDYSFTVCGTATEDTVFYLYQADKNPLGSWRSVQSETAPARYAFSTKVKNMDDRFFIQLVLTDGESNKMWVKGDYTTFVAVKRHHTYRLVRMLIRKGAAVNAKGKLYFELA